MRMWRILLHREGRGRRVDVNEQRPGLGKWEYVSLMTMTMMGLNLALEGKTLRIL
jgi:hypothetical protein